MIRPLLLLIYLLTAPSTDGASLAPYGPEAGDSQLAPGSENQPAPARVPFPVTYLGRRFHYVYVSQDGYVSMGHPANITHPGYPWVQPASHPQTQDPALLVPYYARTLLDGSDKGRVYYRRVDKYSAEGRELLDSQSSVVKHYLLGYADYAAHAALVVTWSEVTFPGYVCLSTTGNCPPRNTFQLLLLTDEKEAVSIINYQSLTWLAGPQHGGSQTSGSTEKFFPLAGFNAGLGHGWTALPLSGTAGVTGLVRYDRGSQLGQFINLVSRETVRPGGCSNNKTDASLQLYPEHGTFHGGNAIQLSGPCLPQDAGLVRCKFLESEVQARRVSDVVAECVVPLLGWLGPVDVSLSVDGGKTFPYQTSYYLDYLYSLRLENPEKWTEINPSELSITWNPADLSLDKAATVNVLLYGFNVTKEYHYIRLHTLGHRVPNSGRFTFKPEKSRCVDYLCADYVTGVLRVSISAPDRIRTPEVWSRATSILWYSYNVNTVRYGERWAHQKCDRWYRKEMADRKWLDNLPECPCRLQQALVDFRFRTQSNCDMYGDTTCPRHQGAKHCVLSEFTSSSGAGTQCCYGDDDLLRHAYDSRFGGFSHKVNPLGAPPYTIPLLPGVGHALLDGEPYNLCCVWSSVTCDRFISVRPTQQCHNYIPNKLAFVYGDPHFRTFGGVRFTFNGLGEYVLFTSQLHNTTVQGRFTQAVDIKDSPVQASVLSAVVITDDDSATIQFTLNTPGFDWDRRVMVHVDGSPVLFHSWNTRQHYKGCIITEHKSRTPHSNYTVLLNSGLGLRVSASSRLLRVVVSAPNKFRSKTSGLLGGWGQYDGVLRDPKGVLFLKIGDSQALHNQFGQSWLVLSEDRSLFTYLHGTDHATYYKPAFKPTFPNINHPSRVRRSSLTKITETDRRLPTEGVRKRVRRASMEEMKGLCQGDLDCLYDYQMTGNEELARQTRIYGELATEMVQSSVHSLFCPAFHIPFAIKSTHNYTVGQKLTITGCDVINGEYQLTGNTHYACVLRGGKAEWEPRVDAQCYAFPTVPVILGTGGGFLILVIVCVILALYFMYPKFRSIGQSKPWRDLTVKELRLQRRRSARMSRFMMRPRGGSTGAGTDSAQHDSSPGHQSPSPPLSAFERVRRSLRRKSSASKFRSAYSLLPLHEDRYKIS